MPNAFTKHAAARAPVSARAAPPNGEIIFDITDGDLKPRRSAWYVSHSLTKPLNGGRAHIETEPIRKNNPVYGIDFNSPPISSMFFVCVACITEPAQRKSSPLNTA